MALLSINRLFASTGDQIAERIAYKLGYKIISGGDLESKIISYGFPEDKIELFNGKTPLFYKSLTKEYDLYFNYLKMAVLNYARNGNCIFIGKGAFKILEGVENHGALQISTPLEKRVEKTSRERNLNIHKAGILVLKKDAAQRKYYKRYFNCDITDSSNFDLTITAQERKTDMISDMLIAAINNFSTPEKEEKGRETLEKRITFQTMIHLLIAEYELPISQFSIEEEGKQLILKGITNSSAVADRAMELLKYYFPEYEVKSQIRAAQDYKAASSRG